MKILGMKYSSSLIFKAKGLVFSTQVHAIHGHDVAPTLVNTECMTVVNVLENYGKSCVN